MINFLFNRRCQILRRQSGTKDSWREYRYEVVAEVDCIWTEKAGMKVRDSRGEDVIIVGFISLLEEVLETDQFLMDGYVYEISAGGITKNTNTLTGEVEFYRVAISRRRLYSENEIAIS